MCAISGEFIEQMLLECAVHREWMSDVQCRGYASRLPSRCVCQKRRTLVSTAQTARHNPFAKDREIMAAAMTVAFSIGSSLLGIGVICIEA